MPTRPTWSACSRLRTPTTYSPRPRSAPPRSGWPRTARCSRVVVHPVGDARRQAAHRAGRPAQGPRALRRRRDDRVPRTAPLLAAADPAGRGARARARPPVPGQRLPTPPGSQGFAVHSDSHDVFVFQTAGAKQWEVHTRRRRRGPHARAGPERLPAHRHAARRPGPGDGVAACHPRHQPAHLARPGPPQHRGRCSTTCPTTTYLPATSTTRPPSPTALPTGSAPLADRYAGIDPRAAVDAEVRRFLTGRSPPPRRGSRRRAPARDLDDTTMLRRRAGHPCVLLPPRRPARGAARRPLPRRPRLARPALTEIRRARAAARPTWPTTSTSRAGWCSAAGWSARACWRSGVTQPLTAPASGAPAPACCATSRSPAPRRTSGLPPGRVHRRLGGQRAPGRPAARRARQPPAPVLARRRGAGRCWPGGPDRSGTDDVRVFAAYADPLRPWLESAAFTDIHEVLDLDLAALGPGRSSAWTRRRLAVLRLHARQARRLLRRARPAGRRGARRPRTARRPGRSRTSAATGSPATCWSFRTASTTAGSTRSPRSRSPATHLAGELDLDHLRGRSGLRDAGAGRRDRAAPAARRDPQRLRPVRRPPPRRRRHDRAVRRRRHDVRRPGPLRRRAPSRAADLPGACATTRPGARVGRRLDAR